jgi:hypothetical protein
VKHPAKYSKNIQKMMVFEADKLPDDSWVLDPFAGIGTIHHMLHPRLKTIGVEIEPEWAHEHPRTLEGNSLLLSETFHAEYFDAMFTSPAYGNRMADKYDGRDGSRRHTYRIDLGHDLEPDNGAAMAWGPQYRAFHSAAWWAANLVLKPGALVVLNLANHIRKGVQMPVVEFHLKCFLDMGYLLNDVYEVNTPRMREGANANLRCPEKIIVMWKPT